MRCVRLGEGWKSLAHELAGGNVNLHRRPCTHGQLRWGRDVVAIQRVGELEVRWGWCCGGRSEAY